MDAVPLRVARPHLVRAAVAGAIALAGLIVASSLGQIKRLPGDPALFRERVVACAGAGVLVIAGVLAVRALVSAVRAVARDGAEEKRGKPLGFLISIVGYAIVLVSALSTLDVDMSGLLLGGALTGVVIGIAAQQTLGNFFAGVVLLLVRPFVVGDHVVLKSGALGGEYEGTVVDMGFFYVNLLTASGPVALPNAGVLASAVGPGARSTQEEEVPEEEPGPAEGGAA